MDQKNGGDGKSPLQSRTLFFNSTSGVLVAAAWPFLPESFRRHEYAAPAVAAWFSIANICLRFVSKEAIVVFRRKHENESTTSP